jgi:sensor histidine kinase regulating citrate/malate metabolism
MKTAQRIRHLITTVGRTLLVALLISVFPVLSSAQTKTHAGKTFAQKLVEATLAKHPESDEIAISTNTSRGCVGIASTDKTDIGEKCEKEDTQPMRTGKPSIEKEKDGFDVSLPLHDSTGKIIGTVGVGFKPAQGQTEASVTEMARKIAAEMEAQIPSKAKLFEPSE